MIIKLNDLMNIYENEVRKNTKNKRKIYQFEKYKMINILNIYRELSNDIIRPIKYNIFLVKYPKYRVVMSLNIGDKIINHYVARYILINKLDKYLDDRNIATRTNLGRDYGLKKVKDYMEHFKKYDSFYILKMDISKYFYSIDHEVLKEMLKHDLDNTEYKIMCNIIDSTNYDYINNTIDKLKNIELNSKSTRIKEINEIPHYNKGKGLPIGNMTSQFLAIYYLYKLDHKIIYDYHLKYYLRYMDDFIIIHHDKNYLINIKKKIEEELNNTFKLRINYKKTIITNNREGFTFLGYRFRVINKKTVINISNSTRIRVKKRIKEVISLYKHNQLKLETAFSSINTYSYGFKYGSRLRIRRIIDKYMC